MRLVNYQTSILSFLSTPSLWFLATLVTLLLYHCLYSCHSLLVLLLCLFKLVPLLLEVRDDILVLVRELLDLADRLLHGCNVVTLLLDALSNV